MVYAVTLIREMYLLTYETSIMEPIEKMFDGILSTPLLKNLLGQIPEKFFFE